MHAFTLRLLLASVVLCLWAFEPESAEALQITQVGKSYILLKGPIEPGDFKKVEGYLIERYRSGSDTTAVQLDSAGGNLFEAIQVGRLLRELYIATWITTNYPLRPHAECLSACFFLFAGGIERVVTWSANDFPAVGLHRPYYERVDFSSLRPEVAKSLVDGLESAGRAYLTEVGVDDALVERMFKTPSADIDVLGARELEALNWTDPTYDEKLRVGCGALASEQSHRLIGLILSGTLRTSDSLFKRQEEIAHCRALIRRHDRLLAISRHDATIGAAKRP
jgi:hypothetical protein